MAYAAVAILTEICEGQICHDSLEDSPTKETACQLKQSQMLWIDRRLLTRIPACARVRLFILASIYR